jgi:hypothetical protein
MLAIIHGTPEWHKQAKLAFPLSSIDPAPGLRRLAAYPFLRDGDLASRGLSSRAFLVSSFTAHALMIGSSSHRQNHRCINMRF